MKTSALPPISTRLAGCLISLASLATCVVAEETQPPKEPAAGAVSVGVLGSTRKLVFDGNATFPAETLRRELAADVPFVLASHPAAELAAFLPAIETSLRSGYLNAGFPDAKVVATHDAVRDGGCVVVKIVEGRRFKMGEIQIQGSKAIDPAKLREFLQKAPEARVANRPATVFRKAMEEYEDVLPKAESPAQVAESDGLLKFLEVSSSSDSTDAEWIPGDPVKLTTKAEDPLIDPVRQGLAALGRPLARVHTSHTFRDNGTADLLIRIDDEGPQGIIGKVTVVGCKRNTAEEIASAAGLVAGQPFKPESLDQATVALWNTGCLFPFTVTSAPRGDGQAEVDFTIRVQEIAEAPKLIEKVAPEKETVRRFINQLNEWLAGGQFTDFVLSSKTADGTPTTIGISSSDGILVELQPGGPGERMVIGVSNDGLRLLLNAAEHHGVSNLPIPTDHMRAALKLLPSKTNDGKMGFSFGAGFKSSFNNGDQLVVDLVISPAFVFMKPQCISRDGDQAVVAMESGQELLRLDLTTALPVSGKQVTAEFRDGCVREHLAKLSAEIAANAESQPMLSWLELVPMVAGVMGMPPDGDDSKRMGKTLAVAALVMQPGTLKPLQDLWANWSGQFNQESDFSIPMDPALWQDSNGTMGLLVSLGAMYFSELLAPPDSWVAQFARELLFIYGGKTKFTAQTMQELLDNPALGPVGCYAVAEALKSYSPATSRRFLAKGLSQATAEGFRNDWQLLADSQLGLGQAIEKSLASLAASPPAEVEAISKQLDPVNAAWFRDLLARLRQRPAGQKLAEWITPAMDDYWNQVIGEDMREKFASQLPPPTDPVAFAAVVNGEPLPRVLVQALADRCVWSDPFQPPSADPSRPWTQDPSLATAARIAVVQQELSRQGHGIKPALVEQELKKRFGHLTDEPNEQWLASTGLTREDWSVLLNVWMTRALVGQIFNKEVPIPSDAEAEAYYRQHASELSRHLHVHTIQAKPAGNETFLSLARTARLVRQTRQAVNDGLPFLLMTNAAKANSRAGLEVTCEQDLALLDFPLVNLNAIQSLKAGETTDLLPLPSGAQVLTVESWIERVPQPFAAVKNKVVELLRWQKQREMLEKWCQLLESKADIEVLADPRGKPPESSVFAELLKADSFGAVGQLGVFWEQALAKHPEAATALEAVQDNGILSSNTSVMLADALLAHDQRPLAARCINEALATDAVTTRKEIASAAERHRKAGKQQAVEALLSLLPKGKEKQ